VALEHLVLFAAAAMGALKAGHKQHSNPCRNHDGKNASVHRKPMHQVLHRFTIILEGSNLNSRADRRQSSLPITLLSVLIVPDFFTLGSIKAVGL
jgi:hypothetical protein